MFHCQCHYYALSDPVVALRAEDYNSLGNLLPQPHPNCNISQHNVYDSLDDGFLAFVWNVDSSCDIRALYGSHIQRSLHPMAILETRLRAPLYIPKCEILMYDVDLYKLQHNSFISPLLSIWDRVTNCYPPRGKNLLVHINT